MSLAAIESRKATLRNRAYRERLVIEQEELHKEMLKHLRGYELEKRKLKEELRNIAMEKRKVKQEKLEQELDAASNSALSPVFGHFSRGSPRIATAMEVSRLVRERTQSVTHVPPIICQARRLLKRARLDHLIDAVQYGDSTAGYHGDANALFASTEKQELANVRPVSGRREERKGEQATAGLPRIEVNDQTLEKPRCFSAKKICGIFARSRLQESSEISSQGDRVTSTVAANLDENEYNSSKPNHLKIPIIVTLAVDENTLSHDEAKSESSQNRNRAQNMWGKLRKHFIGAGRDKTENSTTTNDDKNNPVNKLVEVVRLMREEMRKNRMERLNSHEEDDDARSESAYSQTQENEHRSVINAPVNVEKRLENKRPSLRLQSIVRKMVKFRRTAEQLQYEKITRGDDYSAFDDIKDCYYLRNYIPKYRL